MSLFVLAGFLFLGTLGSMGPGQTASHRCLLDIYTSLFPTVGVDGAGTLASVLPAAKQIGLNPAQTYYAVAYQSALVEQARFTPITPLQYGHRQTVPAERSQLQRLPGAGPGQRDEYLRPEAAQAWFQMQRAARAAGIQLAIADSYRTEAEQARLFARQVQRRGNRVAAAQWSAPPGYSEHHTGYALDLAGSDISGLLHPVQDRAVWQWVQQHGPAYGWEISFQAGNPFGITPEPWHIRYLSARSRSALGLAPVPPVQLEALTATLRQSLVTHPPNFAAVDRSLGMHVGLQIAPRASQLLSAVSACPPLDPRHPRQNTHS
ncbi:M15 family metallopeptidase [Lyngbya confervoides]|uniref:M15 family metallopeptidase n=1 Tax=Lyngbya confervoides BDU141951 TaxID=1574623 RepID=A0ABD4T8H5_9CYAN|nr:M15 family metallopeptidase [Lyngbya confervoides]MCM1984810.1 M15 family metallopeptidase [Lyngbya confervoides BDU141951]